MSEAPKTHRRRLLFAVRALFVVMTLIVAMAVIAIEISHFQNKVDTDSVDRLPDAAKAIRPWIVGLFRVLPFVLLASVLCAAYAVFRKSGRECNRLLLAAFVGFLVFVAGIAGSMALFYRVFIPAVWPRHDFANQPGTLTSVGERAPDITVTSVDGPSIRLADLRGRVVLVNFFATWCGPCKMELPELQEIWNEFHDRDEFRMFVIGREESAETLRAFKDENGFTFPMASDLDHSTFDRFATESIPRTYLIARDGNIVYQCCGYDFEKEELRKLRTILKNELAQRK